MGTDEIPLSLVQESLWRRALSLPAGRQFVSSAVLRIDGALDRNILESALRVVFTAHPELSSRLVERADGPVLVLGQDGDDWLEVVDLAQRSRAEQLLEAQRLVTELARTPIDLRTDRVARARLIRLDADTHRLVIAVHPVIADVMSLSMTFDQFVQTYAALMTNQPVPQTKPMVNAEQVRRRREAGQHSREDVAAFWAGVLPDELEPLSLPRTRAVADLPAPGGLGEHTPCLIPPRLVRAARELANACDTTVFVVMLAALALVVHRYGGHRVVPLIVPVNTRASGEEREFGAFTTSLPIVAEFDDTTSFVELVAALRDRYEETVRNSGYPFSLLTDIVDTQPGPPLTQVGARYLRRPPMEAEFGDLRIAFDSHRSTRADVDLQLEVFDHDETFAVGFIHSTDVFDAATVARIAGHYREVLASSLEHSRRQIGVVQLLTQAEERQIRFLWNRTSTPFPDGATVHRLIEEAVANYPGAPAISFGGRTLSYADFNAAANRVAHRLRALGAGPGTRIGVLLERSCGSSGLCGEFWVESAEGEVDH